VKTKRPVFVKLPVRWIDAGGLKAFKWHQGGSDETAALMLLAVLAHHIDAEDGTVQLTYDQLCHAASLSRAKVAGGLAILEARRLIERIAGRRSGYRLVDYNPLANWAKFPVRGLYRGDRVQAFTPIKLRARAEMDALKLYFLFAARRSNELNMAPISYEKITEHSGVANDYIRPALNILAVNDLVHTERFTSTRAEGGIAHAYRLTHLDGNRHLGTIGRDSDFDLGLPVEDAVY
jgi:DNA-binding IscR family transcriptional regulator